MADGTVFKAGWTLDDVAWDRFDASKVEPDLLAAVKAAALVEYNAQDYVTYLKRVFKRSDEKTVASIEQWGREENQHGRALGRWAELADPNFNLEEAFARFRAGYQPAHFAGEDENSVRGSRRGEMVSRCVVESGTSSYYSSMRDVAKEPVLKEIAGRIAADEFRHYKLFYEILHAQPEADISRWRKLLIAITRINESDDDEIAYSYYCANVPTSAATTMPYKRAEYARKATVTAMSVYREQHIRKLVQMVAKAVGANPAGRLTKIASVFLWQLLRMRAGFSGAPDRAPA